jgi:hypothetical protein
MQFQLQIFNGSGSTPSDCPNLREGKGPKTKPIFQHPSFEQLIYDTAKT